MICYRHVSQIYTGLLCPIFVLHVDRLLADAKLKGASLELVETMHKIIESLMFHQERVFKIIGESGNAWEESWNEELYVENTVTKQVLMYYVVQIFEGHWKTT